MRFLAIGGKRFLITLGVLAIATCGARGEEGWLIDTVDSSPHMLGYASMATLSSGYPAIA
jgi:hypothetical protein